MNEVQSACLAGTVKSWSTAALTLLDSAAYFHRKSFCYLVSTFHCNLPRNTSKCVLGGICLGGACLYALLATMY